MIEVSTEQERTALMSLLNMAQSGLQLIASSIVLKTQPKKEKAKTDNLDKGGK